MQLKIDESQTDALDVVVGLNSSKITAYHVVALKCLIDSFEHINMISFLSIFVILLNFYNFISWASIFNK